MKEVVLEKLKKSLRIEYICTIVACFSSALSSVGGFIDFSGTNDYDEITKAVYAMFSTVVLALLAWIIMDVKKKGTPFVSSIVCKLKTIAIIVMLGAIVPDLVTEVVKFVAKVSEGDSAIILFEISLGTKTVFILWLGIIIGIISEIFKYGVKLQEDNDSIA
jgi:hypothetical protein